MVNVKPPSKHGLERKFKPWRRGKSEKSNKRSSLKQQLRGVERLLKKVASDDSDRRNELESKIQQLKQEIDAKQKVLLEKKNAEKAHGQRFLDRQRLTRQEKQARKLRDKSEMEGQLYKIALDQVYVAHHPTDVKYMPLFRKGNRVVDNSRQLFRRAVTRRRILKSITDDKKQSSWVSNDQYSRLPTEEWTIQDEERVFGGSIAREAVKEARQKIKEQVANDSRFKLAPQHDEVLQKAGEAEETLDEQDDEIVAEVRDSSDSEESSTQKGLPGTPAVGTTQMRSVKQKAKYDSEESSDDESESDDDSALLDPMSKFSSREPANLRQTVKNSAEDSSDSDSSSDSSDEEDDDVEDSTKKEEAIRQDVGSGGTSSGERDHGSSHKVVTGDVEIEEDEEDDFLMDAKDDDDLNVFSMTLKKVPALGEARGDKSKGWETQRQLPGQFKKRRVRR